jgi:peptidoglycan/xylan/chitin deacetylase (PgdA/CDA1 family)
MRKRFGVLLAAFFYYTGLVRLFRRRMRRMNKRVIILNYHRASEGPNDIHLRKHMEYLRRHYRIMHLEEALEQLYAPTSDCGTDQRTMVVLTFDDGYYDNYTHGFTLASELHVPITIFLIPGYIESGRPFWWCEGERLVQKAGARVVMLDDVAYDLTTPAGRAQFTHYIDMHLRYATSVAEREAFLAHVYEVLGVSPALTAGEEKDRSLTWGEILKMQESGWVSFGAHTMHHPILSYLADPAEVRHEVEASRYVLELRLGRPVRTFAYPVGQDEHINQKVLETVREAGFSWAVTALSGIATAESQPLLINRLLTDSQRHWLVLAAETSGIWQYFAPLWKKVLGK